MKIVNRLSIASLGALTAACATEQPTEDGQAVVVDVIEQVEELATEVDRDEASVVAVGAIDAMLAPLGEPAAHDGGNRTGLLSIDLGFGFIGGRETHIREPSMCNGSARAWVYYNRDLNKVLLFAYFDGLPHELDYCYDYDPSTSHNQYPLCVEDGAWQMWFAGRYLTRESTFYYDGTTGELLGNEFDLAAPPPPDAIPLDLPVVQMVCSPTFYSTPWNEKFVLFQFDYDQILDAVGNGGVFAGGAPTNLFDPTSLDVYYTNDGLPPSEAMNMDDILDDIEAAEAGVGFGNLLLATSLEPEPKPGYLASRDNLMIGWGGSLLDASATGLPVDLTPYGECGTFQLPDPFTP
ncbi:MAG: hypothetical protein K0V04_16525 [Deltaproteobacteria bacterium]|nr:hypothetical protein [Deltaproteobacteria bacterium]